MHHIEATGFANVSAGTKQRLWENICFMAVPWVVVAFDVKISQLFAMATNGVLWLVENTSRGATWRLDATTKNPKTIKITVAGELLYAHVGLSPLKISSWIWDLSLSVLRLIERITTEIMNQAIAAGPLSNSKPTTAAKVGQKETEIVWVAFLIKTVALAVSLAY
jgi:hypothetical protein